MGRINNLAIQILLTPNSLLERSTPFHTEGQFLFDALAELVEHFFIHYPWCSGDILIDPSIIKFFKRMKSWSNYRNNPTAKADEDFFGLYSGDKLQCTGVKKY